MGRPLYGYVMDGYWQDIGNLDQYRQANFDALDEPRSGSTCRGSACAATSGSVRASSSTTSSRIERARLRRQLLPDQLGVRRSGRTRCWRRGVTVREHASVARSVIDAPTYLGRSATVEGAIVGRSCDIRAHVRVHEGGRSATSARSATRASCCPGSGSTRSRRSSPARSSIERHLGVARRRARGRQGRDLAGSSTSTSRPRSRSGSAWRSAPRSSAGSRVVASRSPAARLPARQAGAARGHLLDRRPRRRSPRDARGRQPPPPEVARRRRRDPRAAERSRPRRRCRSRSSSRRASRRRRPSRRRSSSTTRARSSGAPRTPDLGDL